MQANEQVMKVDIVEAGGKFSAMPQAKFHTKKDQPLIAPIAEEDKDSYAWIEWGKNNKFPTEIRESIAKVPMAGTAIYKLIAMMYGNGIAYYRNDDLKEGTNPKRAYIPEVEDFLKRNKIKTKWLVPQCGDYRYYMNCFSEFILNVRKDEIVGMYHKIAEFSRLSKQNEKTLHVDELIYSSEFAKYGMPTEAERAHIPLYRWYDEEGFLKKLKGYKFAYHSKFETPGAQFYAKAFWNGLFKKNGWMEASSAVPEIVNAMMRNQIILKYQILIPESYFEIRYQDWSTYNDAQKEERRAELVKSINDNLSGTENAYASITTFFKQDISGNPIGKVEIVAIDDKMKNDNWVPSSEKADAQIVQTLGLHPSQVGLGDRSGMGAGSGSDQREGFNTGITLNTIDQEVVLEPLNFVAEFNARKNKNWDVTFFIDHTHHTTTNNQESGLVPSENSITPE